MQQQIGAAHLGCTAAGSTAAPPPQVARWAAPPPGRCPGSAGRAVCPSRAAPARLQCMQWGFGMQRRGTDTPRHRVGWFRVPPPPASTSRRAAQDLQHPSPRTQPGCLVDASQHSVEPADLVNVAGAREERAPSQHLCEHTARAPQVHCRRVAARPKQQLRRFVPAGQGQGGEFWGDGQLDWSRQAVAGGDTAQAACLAGCSSCCSPACANYVGQVTRWWLPLLLVVVPVVLLCAGLLLLQEGARLAKVPQLHQARPLGNEHVGGRHIPVHEPCSTHCSLITLNTTDQALRGPP